MPSGFILNGCAWPNPFQKDIVAMENGWASGGDRNVFFIIGGVDDINPPEGAMRVRDCLDKAGFQVDTCYHGGGHSVPVRDP